ncbi:MAG: helix-turn-helix transcriptional regulator [Cyanobacteria bacterium P01_B01_bin.77]
MTTRLVLNHWEDWLEPGSPSDTRLLHSDSCDRVLTCPPHLGQGYKQEIQLRDDLSLWIHDYTTHNDVVIDAPGESNLLEFDFISAGHNIGYSVFVPYFGFREVVVKRAQKRVFKVKVAFKPPAVVGYFQAFLERLSPQTQPIAENLIRSMYRHRKGYSSSTTAEMLHQILQPPTGTGSLRSISADPHFAFEQAITEDLYTEMFSLGYAACRQLSSEMERVMGQALSCPYQGATRRSYLEDKALKLVLLHLEDMVRPCLKEADLNSIHEAAAILRKQSVIPPTLEELCRQVGSNRFKLNQGFHQVYGTTPFGYLRACRIWQAQRLLRMSNMSVGQVATAVGYTNCSRFASAFRKQTGINPKAFQMQVCQWAS